MKRAAAGWEEDYAKKMVAEGFGRGRGAPTVFHNRATEVRVVVHGDDFTFSGTKVELDRMSRKRKSGTTSGIEGRWEADKGISRR